MKKRLSPYIHVPTVALVLLMQRHSVAYAQSNALDPVVTGMDTLVDYATGPLGISVCAVVMVGLGIAMMRGQFDADRIIHVVIGMSVAFGALSIAVGYHALVN